MDGMKTCPRCAEDVKEAAQVCRYCGHEFANETAAAPPPPPPAPSAVVPPAQPALVPPPAASVAPPPAAVVAAPSAPPTAVPPPAAVAAPSAPPAAPPPPAPAYASSYPAGGYAGMPETFQLKPRYKAAPYLAVSLTIDNGQVTFAGMRTEDAVMKRYWLLMGLAIVVPLMGLGAVAVTSYFIRTEEAESVYGMLAVLALALIPVGMIAAAIWFSSARSRYAHPYSATVPIHLVQQARHGYDWDLGCGLMILLAFVPGLVIMLVLGKRIVKMRAPFDHSAIPTDGWAFKAASAGEAERLTMLLRNPRA